MPSSPLCLCVKPSYSPVRFIWFTVCPCLNVMLVTFPPSELNVSVMPPKFTGRNVVALSAMSGCKSRPNPPTNNFPSLAMMDSSGPVSPLYLPAYVCKEAASTSNGGFAPAFFNISVIAAFFSSADEKNAAITEMLKKAGAKPPLEVEAATLQTYAGKYKGDTGPELSIIAKEGKLFVGGFGRDLQPLMALNATTFRPVNFGGITLTFNSEGGKVTSMTFKQGQTVNQMKRTGE